MKLFILTIMLLPLVAHASTARIVDVSGVVERVDLSGNAIPAQRGDSIADNETLRTDETGRARLLLDDLALIDLAPASRLRLNAHADITSATLSQGQLWARISTLSEGHGVEIDTPSATAAVRGTSFFTQVESDATTVSVEVGSVDIINRYGEHIVIGASESARATARSFERSRIEGAGLRALRERIASQERPDGIDGAQSLDLVRSSLGRSDARLRAGRDHGRLHEAIREILRNRRDNPLDIDPAQARRLLERLRELRERRRDRR